ncbi:MAG: S8 family serine peptidase [Gammaproteobacteria bacterium]|jgi:subtilisin family serine protease
MNRLPGNRAGRIGTAVFMICLASSAIRAAEPSTPAGPLRSADDVGVAKPARAIYLVRLREASASAYAGGRNGLAATRPAPGTRLDRRDSDVQSYIAYLERTHAQLLAEIGAPDSKIYSFGYALNGFAAQLTAAQATQLAQRDEVERVWLDKDHKVRTNNSSLFLGLLDPDEGLRANKKLSGEGIVVGVVDSGIATDHPSLSDFEEHLPRACSGDWARNSWLGRWLCHAVRNDPPTTDLYDPPADFAGVCQTGDGFSVRQCTDKVVGARYYIDGFLARHTLDESEFISPKDADGHGTHIATIIAGNPVSATLFGTRVARVSGIAPRAQIAVYKACWLKPGELRATCTTADLARAIDDAVADGVDIINYSVGSLETELTDPDDIALLNAFDAGVLTVVAAGNDGPDLATIGSPSSAPWVLTAAASTQSGTGFEEAIEITAPADAAGLLAMREASFTRALRDGAIEETAVVLSDDGVETVTVGSTTGTIRDACDPLINAESVSGSIALIQRGNCDFDIKLRHAENAGAVAAIVYNNSGGPFPMNGTDASNIPAVMIGVADGQELVDHLTNDEVVTATLAKGTFLEREFEGLEMASFSSRGPGLSDENFLKPDVTAPGVDILAGHTRDAASGLRGEDFQYLSGTSMSTPETAGVAALLLEANPDWSPATLKSALMTTAYQDVVGGDPDFYAHPFEMGAGHIDGNRALDPGLVYESDFLDYAAYLCGLETSPFPEFDCGVLRSAGFSFSATDVNLPSFGIAELISGDSVTRRVTNIGPPGTYTVAVEPPFGVNVFVEPPELTLGTGETGSFEVWFETEDPDYDLWSFGRLEWWDGTHSVMSPIAVAPVLLRAPAELRLSGTQGSAILPVDFGYSGVYDATVHGLNPPFYSVIDEFIEDDPTNSFSFRNGNGVAQHYFTVANNDLHVRISMFDSETDGDDDLDLYLYYCRDGTNCEKVAESGSFTSQETIDLAFPPPGDYALLVHGFETDQSSGGPGAYYSLHAWTYSANDEQENLLYTIPTDVAVGDRYDLDVEWGELAAGVRYFGAIQHYTDTSGPAYDITLVSVAP